MKIVKRIFLGLLVVVILAVGGVFAYLYGALPKVGPAADLTVTPTPELIARGEYMANHVTGCIDCHSNRDINKYSCPLVPGTHGMGGFLFDENFGVPGKLYSRNITPAGIRDWTDGELARAITAGVSKDGHPLFPLMPYFSFAQMSKEDLRAIISYIRTLEPIENIPPDRSLNFPMNLIVRMIPEEPQMSETAPSPSDTVAYGKYLATIAACSDCHTPMVKGQYVMDSAFAGGYEFRLRTGVCRSANITPDDETGIGLWSKESFLARFQAARSEDFKNIVVEGSDKNTVMPWIPLSGMTDEDLGAIYAYLRTLPPIKHRVEHWTPSSGVALAQ